MPAASVPSCHSFFLRRCLFLFLKCPVISLSFISLTAGPQCSSFYLSFFHLLRRCCWLFISHPSLKSQGHSNCCIFFYVAVHNCLSAFLCLALTLETLMSFRYLCSFSTWPSIFFDFLSGVAIDGECCSADRFHMYCRFCCLFFFLLCIRHCLCCGSVVEPCVGSCRGFFVVLQLRPVHVDCHIALIHRLVLVILLHVILVNWSGATLLQFSSTSSPV